MLSIIGITIHPYIKNPTYGIDITNEEIKVIAFNSIAITISHLMMLTIPMFLISLITFLTFNASDKLLKYANLAFAKNNRNFEGSHNKGMK